MSIKKILLFTGIGGTLGRTFSENFSTKYHIIGTGRKSIQEDISDYFIHNLSEDSHSEFIERILNEYGQIDILINNAVYSRWNHISETTFTDLTNQFAVNVAAPVALANACFNKYWSTRPSGENALNHRGVINISSIAAVKDYFGNGQGTYAATKAALNTITRHMGDDYKKYGLKVNCLAPNSFPGLVSVEKVADCIDKLIEGDYSGKTLVLDVNAQYIL